MDNLEQILNIIIEQKKIAYRLENLSEVFEIFTAEQILKKYNVDFEEIKQGITDGCDDGGLDSIYIFINNVLIDEDLAENDPILKLRNPKISIELIQSKNKTSFEEIPLKIILSTIKDFTNLSINFDSLVYNDSVKEKIKLFHGLYKKILPLHPNLFINLSYATKGDINTINKKMKNIELQIIADVKAALFDNVNINMNYIGSKELIEMERKQPTYNLQLKSDKILYANKSYLALVKIKDYYDFLTDEDKNIRQYLFDANIRDFQGSVEVNKDIKDTLECKFELDTDFWWLNNGITILASKVTTAGDIITMDNLQIVNGLQTSHSIYNCFTNIIQENKEKLVFIKIIEIENQEDLAITKIIKATNFQTPIAIPSFRASDSIQKDIEDFLKSKGLYYDRRKNYYKNQGKNVNEIITMQTMAQCINALVLKNPGLSRRSPAGLTKKDDKYNEIFNSTDMNLYSNAILFMRKANSIIRDFYQDPAYKKRECLNLSFHISLRALQIFLNKIDFGTDDIIKINVDLLTIEIVKTALEEVITKAREQEVTKGETILNIAKSVDFSELVKTGNIVK